MKNLFFCFFLLSTIACSKENPTPPSNPDPVVPTDTTSTEVPTIGFNYLALGDSYTIGQNVSFDKNFPNQLAQKLTEDGDTIESVKIIAQTGWTTTALLGAINSTSDFDSIYNFVTVLIGVNNEYRGQPADGTFDDEFPIILEKAIEFAGGIKEHVFVVSIPDYAYTPSFANDATVSRRIDEYNAVKKQITEDFELTWIDITDISREGLNSPSLVANDNLHPSAQQYEEWVMRIKPMVELIF